LTTTSLLVGQSIDVVMKPPAKLDFNSAQVSIDVATDQSSVESCQESGGVGSSSSLCLHDGLEKREWADLSFLRFWSLELLLNRDGFLSPHSCLSVWRSVLSEQTDLADLVDWEWLSNVSERLSLA